MTEEMTIAGPEEVVVRRPCKGTLLPDNVSVLIPKDMRLIVEEASATGLTVKTHRGDVVWVDITDADALGDKYVPAPDPDAPAPPFDEAAVWDAMRTVYDPEIPVNIVDLGLVYDCRCSELPGGGHSVVVMMTLTAPGCGMSELIKANLEQAIYHVPGVRDVQANIVFNPPWGPEMMTEAARLELGFM